MGHGHSVAAVPSHAHHFLLVQQTRPPETKSGVLSLGSSQGVVVLCTATRRADMHSASSYVEALIAWTPSMRLITERCSHPLPTAL